MTRGAPADAAAATERCTGCGVVLPVFDGATHRYMLSSPSCWAAYGEVLAREYSSAEYMAVHRLTVDAYAVQHPGVPGPQSIQSVAAHLLSLHVVLELGWSHEQARHLLGRATRFDRFTWLTPPVYLGGVTVVDVLPATSAAEHRAAVERWARSAWQAWAAHHAQVRAWGREVSGGDRSRG